MSEIEKSDKQNSQETPKSSQSHFIATSFQGPFPPPDYLAEYEKRFPGSAERIIKWAENEQSHRMTVEKEYFFRPGKQASKGQFFGFVLAVLGMVFSSFLVWQGFDVKGTIFAGTIMLALAALFVTGRSSRPPKKKKSK